MKIFEIIGEDPLKAAAIAAILLVFWFLKRDYEGRAEQFKEFETKMKVWEGYIHQEMREVRDALNRHTDSMGKATKAINGDMLRIQESVFELKSQLSERVELLKILLAQVERETKAVHSNLELVVDKFDSKFARFVELKKEVEYLNGRVEKLDENFGKVIIGLEKMKGKT